MRAVKRKLNESVRGDWLSAIRYFDKRLPLIMALAVALKTWLFSHAL